MLAKLQGKEKVKRQNVKKQQKRLIKEKRFLHFAVKYDIIMELAGQI